MAGLGAATDGTWTGNAGTGSWAATNNWLNGSVPAEGGKAYFKASGPNLSVDVANLMLGGIYLGTANVYFNGNTFQLVNNPEVSTPATELRVMQRVTGDQTVLAKKGGSVFRVYQDFSGFSEVSVRGGTTVAHTNATTSFVRGALAFNNGCLSLEPTLAIAGGALTLGGSEGAVAVRPGVNVLEIVTNAANPTVAVTLGTNVVRTSGGVLAFNTTGGRTRFGNTIKILLPQDLTVNGMAPAYLSLYDNTATPKKTYTLLAYDAVKGLIPFTAFASDFSGGATSVVRLASDTTLTTNVEAYAVQLDSGATVTIGSGKTLKVGDGVNPAGIVLNSSDTKRATLTGGAIDFGASQGIFWSNEAQYGGNGTQIYSAIRGSNGVVFAGIRPSNNGAPSPLTLYSAGDYSGETHLAGGRIYVNHIACFGRSSDVYVWGDERAALGSELLISAAGSLTNNLHLIGNGFDSNNTGSLRFSANASILGTIELMGPTTIRCVANENGSTFAAYLKGSVYGTGTLQVASGFKDTNGMTFAANSTYVGDTTLSGYVNLRNQGTLGKGIIANSGILTLSSESLGLGFLQNQGTVNWASGDLGPNVISNSGRFNVVKSTDAVLSNSVVGVGRLNIANGTTTVVRAALQQNSLSVMMNSSVVLTTNAVSVGELDGVGRIEAQGDAALVVGSSSSGYSFFAGQLADGSGKLSLVKVGTNVLGLSGASSYSGATIISNGTLRLERIAQEPPFKYDLSVWLDASAGSTIVTNSAGQVTNWVDRSALGARYVKSAGLVAPAYARDAFGGKGGLRFTGIATNRLQATLDTALCRTLFIVNKPTGYDSMDGLLGYAGTDYGIRMSSATTWTVGSKDFFILDDAASTRVNGVTGYTFMQNQTHVLSTISQYPRSAIWSIGNYVTTASAQAQPRAYTGDIGEILMYSQPLTSTERGVVEAYLMNKWMGTSLVQNAASILPQTSAVTIAEGGVLDLNGLSQEVAGLSGGGMITNRSAAPATLIVNAQAGIQFSGAIRGDVQLIKRGAGDLKISTVQAYSGGTTIEAGRVVVSVMAPTNGLVLRLDAADARASVSGAVTNWPARVGGSAFVSAAPYTPPTRIENALNGMPAVRFDGVSNRLSNATALQLKTLVVLNQVEGYNQFGGLFGAGEFGDFGLRQDATNTWQKTGPTQFIFPGDNGSMYINGVAGNTYAHAVPHIVAAQAQTSKSMSSAALGFYYGNEANPTRYYKGRYYELLAYSRGLTPEERIQAETYLQLKWLGAGLKNVLPTNAVSLASGALLDLGGTTQSFTSVSGAGSIINGTVEITGEIHVSVAENGQCTPFEMASNVTLSGARLVFDHPEYLKTGQPVVLCGGTLSGVFASSNLPDGWVITQQGNALYVYPGGTVMLIR